MNREIREYDVEKCQQLQMKGDSKIIEENV